MKLTCERCRAQYDIDDSKIPPSGFQMTCPACSHVMKVAASAVTAPRVASGPREIALSSLGEDEPAAPAPPSAAPAPAGVARKPPASSPALELADMDFADLSDPPAALAPPPAAPIALALDPPPPVPARAHEVVDLPTPKVMKPPAAAPGIVDLPTPKVKPPATPGVVDLPTPKVKPPATPGVVDLPTPKVKPPATPSVIDLPTPKVKPPATPSVIDLPTPKVKPPATPGVVDLPTPKTSPPPIPDLPTPKRPPPPPAAEGDMAIPLDLDAPDVDDVPTSISPGSTDLPRPRDTAADGVQPREVGIDGVQPQGTGGIDGVQPQATASEDLASLLEPGPPAPAVPGESDDENPKARGRRVALFAGGGVALAAALAGGAYAMGLFGDGGAAQRALDGKLTNARQAIVADLPQSLRKAVLDLKPYSGAEKPSVSAVDLEAEVHLSLARLGVAGEATAAKSLLELPVTSPPGVDHTRASGLLAALGTDVANGRHILKDLAARDPKDALTLGYLGFAELAGHDLDAASQAFTRATAADPSGALYSYGLGLVQERLGNDKAARAAYGKALAASPMHARARIGVLRIDARAGDATAATQLEAFTGEHAAELQPRERAELMVALGQLALSGGRWDEADERFKKALALNPDVATSYVAYDARLGSARARVEAGHAASVLDDLHKLASADLHDVEVRLILARALIDLQKRSDAEPLLVAVEKLRPKDPRVAYQRARLLLATTSPTTQDREQAVEQLKAAVATDPHLFAAWANLARAQNNLGHTSDAVETLGQAAGSLAGDARGAAALGAAYLAIGRPADAEARFRAVLTADAGKPPVLEHLPIALGLAEALEAQGKLDEAAQAYTDAQTLAPKSALVMERRARLAERNHKLDEAKTLYDQALQLGPPTASLRLSAASLAVTQHRLDDARKLAEPVIQDDDRSAPAYVLLARVALLGGHADEGLGLARRAVMLADEPAAHLVLAEMLEQNGKLDDALKEFKYALHPPVLEEASLGLARVLVHSGQTKDALAVLPPLAKSSNVHVQGEAYSLMGDAYGNLQQRDKALRAYQDAVSASPNDPDGFFKLGRALLDAGRSDAGVTALERALKGTDEKTSWVPDAYLLLGDSRRLSHANEAAIRAYTKYLQLAPASAPMRAEAAKQISLLGGTPPASP